MIHTERVGLFAEDPRYIEAMHHPLVVRAEKAALDPVTLWRLRYNLAPTDPVFLEATEEEILEDLLVLAFHQDAVERVRDPDAADAKAQRMDPQRARQMLLGADALARDEGFRETLRRVRPDAGKFDPEKAPPRGPMRVIVKTNIQSREKP